MQIDKNVGNQSQYIKVILALFKKAQDKSEYVIKDGVDGSNETTISDLPIPFKIKKNLTKAELRKLKEE